MGQPVPQTEQLLWCIGPPLQQSFAQLINEESAPHAVELYRERFAEIGLYENSLYPEIPGVLESLKQSGATLHVASSKPHVYVNRILEHFQLDHFFKSVFGAELNGTRGDKTTLLQHALEQTECSARDAIMIGDRHHDCTGALNNAMGFIGVLYGYGSSEELLQAGALRTVDAPHQLVEFCARDNSG